MHCPQIVLFTRRSSKTELQQNTKRCERCELEVDRENEKRSEKDKYTCDETQPCQLYYITTLGAVGEGTLVMVSETSKRVM